uniref:Uncharacterized protein n=1 Tax=Myotis myotis TaxID=51298 RepID=A0A7J7VZB8_MYOMY|nr:hypothetical protein mMyoMyo1_012331 [Myotis myotis]
MRKQPRFLCPKQDFSRAAHWPSLDFLRAMLWSEAPPAHSYLLLLLSQVADPHCGRKAFPPYCCSLFLFFIGISPNRSFAQLFPRHLLLRRPEHVESQGLSCGSEGKADACPPLCKGWNRVPWPLLLPRLGRNLSNCWKPL